MCEKYALILTNVCGLSLRIPSQMKDSLSCLNSARVKLKADHPASPEIMLGVQGAAWETKSYHVQVHSTKQTNQSLVVEAVNKVHDVLHSVNCKGSYQGETKCIPASATSKNSDALFDTHSTVDWRNLGEMKLNELGRQKLDR